MSIRARTYLVACFAAGLVALACTGPAWAGGPGGVVEDSGDMAQAVGSGLVNGQLVGYTAFAPDDDAAAAAVVAVCEAAGAQQCTSDEVSNYRLCIMTIGDSTTGGVAGGAGKTEDDAYAAAVARAAAANTPLGPETVVLMSACP